MSWASGVIIRGARPDGSVEQIRFQPTLRSRVIPMLGAVVGVLMGTLMFMLTQHVGPSSIPLGQDMLGPMLAGVFGAGIVAPFNNSGVVLTPATLTAKRFGRGDVTLPWTAIEGFTLRRVMGTTVVVVHCSDHRRIRLHAPTGGFLGDPAFEAKYHTIGIWWTAARERANGDRPL